ncbi:3'(2'),5'-bisphosphate nucleotidase CysQ [Sphingomonas koreensis]|nr:3'(2'),5'-bisphosphate nucleotidase CysQ [Sphingomonas koreensis]
MTDADLAASIAREAGDLLVRIRDERREEGKALGKRGDAEANALILSRLRTERPGDFVLSEEAQDDQARCTVDRVWIVDPLDGTREYGEGRDDWAVHVALSIGGRPAIGAVAMPGLDRVFVSNGVEVPGAAPARLRMVVSRTRPPDIAVKLAEALDAELIPMGSAGAKAMAVVDGRADIYVHAGGQYEWDSCAPVAVALGAGLHASRIDGSPLIYNRADVSLPDLLICRPEHSAALLTLIAGAE